MPPAPFPFRPRPPACAARAGVAWVLRAAFAEPGAGALSGPEREEAVEAGLALGVAARVATRVGRERLTGALGAAGARRLADERARAAAEGLRVLEAAAEVARRAAAAGVPVAWLKFAGLVAAGLEPVGGRGVSDLDLLVPDAAGARLAGALEARGFVRSPLPQPDHQIATLTHRTLGTVDLHRSLPGVRLEGERPVRYEELAGAGRLIEAGAVAPGTWSLEPELLAAHALVHATVQHGRVAAYPHLRALGDLVDLDLGGRIAPGKLAAPTEGELAAADLDALAALVGALRSGAAGSAQDRAALWLDHFLALALVPDYALALRADAALSGHEEGGALVSRLRRLRRLLVLSPAEVEAIYGPQGGRGAILARQLLRPFDLLRRAWASAAARRRLERAGGGG